MTAEHNQDVQSTVLKVQTSVTSLEQERKGKMGLIDHAVDPDHSLRRKKAEDSRVVITL
jgi:hypothetical protein